MQHIVVVYLAAIPVGHRVEIRWYTLVSEGLLGGRNERDREFEPVVVDLDTGIEYTSDHAHHTDEGNIKRPDEPIPVAQQAMGEPARVLRGRVRACRVVHVRRFSELDVQTDLMIEPEG